MDWFTGDTMVTPIKDNPASKNSFIPSKWEHKKVSEFLIATYSQPNLTHVKVDATSRMLYDYV